MADADLGFGPEVVTFSTKDRLLEEAFHNAGCARLQWVEEGADVVLQSQMTIKYTRKWNWWAVSFALIGYLPPSFRISVESQGQVTARVGEVAKEFEAKADASRMVWGRVPDPLRPVMDADYQDLETIARRQVAEILVRNISTWLKDEGIQP